MVLFGIPITPVELVILTLAVARISAALAYALPKPEEKSSKLYTTIYRLIQWVHANYPDRKPAKTPEE
jgi:hypothetical protein